MSKTKKKHNPKKWLREHSNMNHFETGNEWHNDRPKAAIISLVRNEELEGILQSMRQLERHWNRRYNYPWMFFSEVDFTEEFKVNKSLPPITINPLTSDQLTNHSNSFSKQQPTQPTPQQPTT